VALLPFLQDRLDEVAPSAAVAGITLVLDPKPAGDVHLNFDDKSLARAVGNLLLNAVQHTPPGERVALGAELSAETCRLIVKDSGPGIPAADAEHIFEPFVTTRADGVGLGLCLVREIAEAHGGSARCLSPADGQSGAVFAIDIPRHGQNSNS
jgi:signal transduction histidine kinase